MSPKRPNSETKKAKLLGDQNVRRWYDNLSRKSRNTAEVAVRRLSYFCELNDTIPKALAELDRKNILNLILDSISKLEEQGYAGSYIQGIMKAVKSWILFNDIEIKQAINVEGADSTPTLKNQEAIVPLKIDNVLACGDSRAKV